MKSMNFIIVIVKPPPLKKSGDNRDSFIKLFFLQMRDNLIHIVLIRKTGSKVFFFLYIYYSTCGSDSQLWRVRDSISKISWESPMINSEMPYLSVLYMWEMLLRSFLKR